MTTAKAKDGLSCLTTLRRLHRLCVCESNVLLFVCKPVNANNMYVCVYVGVCVYLVVTVTRSFFMTIMCYSQSSVSDADVSSEWVTISEQTTALTKVS